VFTIRQTRKDEDEAAWLQAGFDNRMGWSKPPGRFAALQDRQAQGEVSLMLTLNESAYLGHYNVVWRSAYPCFREPDIPETQELMSVPIFVGAASAAHSLTKPSGQLPPVRILPGWALAYMPI